MNNVPYVLEETDDFAVVFKPSKMHCAPASGSFGSKNSRQAKEEDVNTLLGWFKNYFPPVFDIMHRLDYETHGLTLFAKNEKSFNYFRELQDKNEFIKEYSAVCKKNESCEKIEGFPEYNFDLQDTSQFVNLPLTVESYFRPFGPGRKLVRPVIDDQKKHKEIARHKGGFYKTEITGINGNVFTVRIKRGFRHQIRCHLCWIGYPIYNDPLYSFMQPEPDECELALRSHALFFPDPATGKQKEFRIPLLNIF